MKPIRIICQHSPDSIDILKELRSQFVKIKISP